MHVYFSRFYSPARKEVLIINPEPSRLIVGHEPLRGAELPLREDILYHGNVSDLPDISMASHTNLILFKDQEVNPVLLERHRTNIILTNLEEGYRRAIKDMHHIFDTQVQVSNFASELLILVQDGAKTEKMLELGYSILGNPLFILDTSLCLLHSEGAEPVEEDPVIEHLLSEGYMPEQFLEEVLKEENNAPSDYKTLIIWEKDFLKNRLIAGRIMRGNQLIGFLKMFERNRPITDVFDIEIFKVLCQYVALSMGNGLSERFNNPNFSDTFLLDVIGRKITDPAIIHRRSGLYNFKFQDHMVVIAIEMDERLRKPDKFYLLKQKLQSQFKYDTQLIYKDRIIIIDDSSDISRFSSPQFLEPLREILETNACRAAMSLPFESLDELSAHYEQAIVSFRIADKLKCADTILHYDEHILNHMLLHFKEVFDLRGLIIPCIADLHDLDIQKGSEFVKTLFCYVRHSQDITATANAMHVHYNTLKYRINRIREITGVDLEDPEVIFRIMLAERVVRLLEQTEEDSMWQRSATAPPPPRKVVGQT